jgi:UDP-glucose:glycoprotein glucosyltransferase
VNLGCFMLIVRSFHVGDLDTAIVRVAAVIDPISEEAQVWSSLLKTASEMDNVAVTVYLEPDTQNTEVCLRIIANSD